MKTTQQILQTEYETNPQLKEQLQANGLTLDDVGINFMQSNEYYKQNEPIILNYSMQDEEVVGISISFTHEKVEDKMRVKRLELVENKKHIMA